MINSSNPKDALISIEEILNTIVPLGSERISISVSFWANSHASTLFRQEKTHTCIISSDVLYMLKSVYVQNSPFSSRKASWTGSLKRVQHRLAVPRWLAPTLTQAPGQRGKYSTVIPSTERSNGIIWTCGESYLLIFKRDLKLWLLNP